MPFASDPGHVLFERTIPALTTFDRAAERGVWGRSYDAVIIGSGAGGGTLAYQLTAAGLDVLLVEQGERLRPNPQGPGRPVGRYVYHEWKTPSEPIACVGGQTKFYGAALYRLRESDFEAVEHESGVSPAWPLRYAELAPYYDRAEQLYRVHGAPDGDPSEPPRSQPYPFPPLPQDPVLHGLARRLRHSGTPVASVPRGMDYHPDPAGTARGGRCIMCPTCDAHYCQRDAKMDAETAALAAAARTGRLNLVTGTRCLRVLTDAPGRAVRGVELRLASGEQGVVTAPVVAVCAGLPGSTLLLRRSRTDAHPEGLGNRQGQLGRHLGGHATGMVFPFISLRRLPAAHTKDFAINAFYDPPDGWRYPLGNIQTAGQTPFWDLMPKPMRPVGRFVARHAITCFYMNEALPSAETGFRFDGDRIGHKVLPLYNLNSFAELRRRAVDVFRKAGYRSLARKREPYLWHETGGAVMGDHPDHSVVDPWGEVHGLSGLYVADASVLPSAGAVNTGLTIMALAMRTGERIARLAGAHTATQAVVPDGSALLHE